MISLPSRLESAVSTKTPAQRYIDHLRSTCDLDWAVRAGSQPRTLAMCCEACVYGTGAHRSDCSLGRDHNAARNILALGNSAAGLAASRISREST